VGGGGASSKVWAAGAASKGAVVGGACSKRGHAGAASQPRRTRLPLHLSCDLLSGRGGGALPPWFGSSAGWRGSGAGWRDPARGGMDLDMCLSSNGDSDDVL